MTPGEDSMPVEKLKAFLDSRTIKYTVISHSSAFTAQEIAESAHVSGRELAKTVMVKIDGAIAMAVLPASLRVDFEALRKAAGAKKVELTGEAEFRDLFPGCELGAMPPFGNLYGMKLYADRRLAEDREIAFNAGSHTELVRMSYEDFARLAEPRIVELSSR
jgi:Ala-tRNA(Pro) deacylase